MTTLQPPYSYTKLSSYERCPAMAKFRYIDRIRGPKSPQASRGSDVHTSAEAYLQGDNALHEVLKPYKHILRNVRQQDPFVEYPIGVTSKWKVAPYKIAYNVCVIDSAYIDGNRVEVQEWKTGKVYDDHSEQRHLYLLFARVQWPAAHVYRIQSYYFDAGIKKTLELKKDELDEVQSDFTSRIAIMAGDDVLAARPGYYCGWCPYSRQKGGPCKHG